ncbi:MAG: TlpA family protein disulfide reductase [Parcubacteria group bacterium]|nr:TlpA family protein disulfide reductase [Parcubacteria group bacterium]
MKKTVLIAVVIITLAAIGVVVFRKRGEGGVAAREETNISVAEEKALPDLGEAPDFTLKNYAGETVRLSAIAGGKAAVVNSWAVWCPFCRDELSDFARLQQEFGENVVVVAVDRAESLEKAKGFTDQLGVSDDLTFLLDPQDAFYRSIGGFSMPETIFVDHAGRIRIHKRGPMDFAEMKEKVAQLIEMSSNVRN